MAQVSSAQGSETRLQNSSARSDEAAQGLRDTPEITYLLPKELVAEVPLHKWENGRSGACQGGWPVQAGSGILLPLLLTV